MTVPDATVLARMRRPDITTDVGKRVSDGAAPEDRVAGVKLASERRFVILSPVLTNVKESITERGYVVTGRLDTWMSASARGVSWMLPSRHGDDLRAYRGGGERLERSSCPDGFINSFSTWEERSTLSQQMF